MLLQGYHCCEKVCGCEKNGPLFVKGKYWKGTSGPQRIAAYILLLQPNLTFVNFKVITLHVRVQYLKTVLANSGLSVANYCCIYFQSKFNIDCHLTSNPSKGLSENLKKDVMGQSCFSHRFFLCNFFELP